MNETIYTVIQTTPLDNVGIVPNLEGLPKGALLSNGVVLQATVPMGHKVALVKIPTGSAIIRYGEKIGIANTTIQAGEWVDHTRMLLPEAPRLEDISLNISPKANPEPLEGYTFKGFKNPDGSVGTKNVLAIATSVQCVGGLAQYIEKKIRQELLPKYPNVDEVVALNHSYGCGIAIDAPAAMVPIRTLQNIMHNPNFGGEVMMI